MQGKDIYRNIPSTIAPTLKRFSHTVVFIVINAILSANFQHEFYLTDVYRDMAILPKIVYTLGVMLKKMSTYIIGFTLMDCGPIASGLAYNGDKDGVP